MPNQIELTASQLASLDLLIANKQENEFFIDKIAQVVVQAAQVVVATAAAVAAVGGTQAVEEGNVESALMVANNASLDDLVALRNKAILKQ